MKELFVDLIVRPFYNALIFLMDFVTNDLGVALIILTVIFRFILFPLYKSQIRTQIKTQQIREPLKKIQEKYKNDREAMGREMLALYRQHKINPLSGIFILLIQIPLLIGFYYVFSHAGLPEINTQLIYDFMPRPDTINHIFLGFFDMTMKSIPLSILAGIAQFYQMKILIPKKDTNQASGGSQPSMEEVMHNMQTQMKYIMPGMIILISYSLGSIVALYMLVGSLFSIGQELYIRKSIKGPEEERLRRENELVSGNI